MSLQILGDVFVTFHDLAQASPWPTGVAFFVVVIYFTVKFTDLPKKLKAKIWFAPAKPTPCSNCSFPAEVYSVESKKVYCKFCACLLHHPGMKTEKHSLEALVETEEGVQMISYLLPNFLTFSILFVFFYMVTRPSNDQILGASYCPVIQQARQTLVRWDPSIFYYWKAHFAQFCDFEDSAWRLYIDAWFRGVVTRTDSMFLILAAFVKAFLFEKYIELVLAKVMGVLYGVLAILVRQFEHLIPSRFHFLEDIARSISFNKLIKASGKCPPPTFWRARPMQNWMEGWKYMMDRRTRLFSYYQGHAQAIQTSLLRGLLYGAVFIRLACLFLGADSYLRAFFDALGLGPLMRREQEMFLGLTGHGVVEPEEHQPYYSERLITMGFMHIFSHRALAVSSVLEVGGSIMEGLRGALWPLARMLFFPGLVIVTLRLFYTRTMAKQTAYFNRQWPVVRAEIFGSCSRDDLVDWKNAQFRRKKLIEQ
jgi:hypothetical protein